jgi:hypothetical protein
MSFKSPYLFIFFLPLFSGCFDLIEEVNVHPDGSGSFFFEANLSQSKTKLETIMALDSLDGFKIPSKAQISRKIEDAASILRSAEGISLVSDKIDFDNYIFNMRFDFSQVKFLNQALASLHKSFEPNKTIHETNGFRKDGAIFERMSEYKAPPEMKTAVKKELTLLNDAFLTCIYRFDQPILHFSNPDAKLSKNGKAVLLKLSIPDILNGKKTISDIIQTKN